MQHCESPFSLDVSRKDSQDTEPLLNTSGYNFIFKVRCKLSCAMSLPSVVTPSHRCRSQGGDQSQCC